REVKIGSASDQQAYRDTVVQSFRFKSLTTEPAFHRGNCSCQTKQQEHERVQVQRKYWMNNSRVLVSGESDKQNWRKRNRHENDKRPGIYRHGFIENRRVEIQCEVLRLQSPCDQRCCVVAPWLRVKV